MANTISNGLKYQFDKEKLIIENTNIVGVIEFYLYLKDNCSDVEDKGDTIILNPGEKKEFKVKNLSTYIIEQISSPDNKLFTVENFYDLEDNIIKYIPSLTCKCCCDIVYPEEECLTNHLLNSVIYLESMYRKNSKRIIDLVTDALACNMVEDEICKNTGLTFNSEPSCNIDFSKKLLLHKYLAIYFYKYSALDYSVEKEELYKKYKIEELKCCFKEYNIDLSVLKASVDFEINQMQDVQGTIYININELNKKPDVVGNYLLDATENETILTKEMFTTDTTPQYHDPEGDAPEAVKILTLPDKGMLVYRDNGVDTTIIPDRVVSISDIEQEKLLYIVNIDNAGGSSTTFTFAVSDVGSHKFSK